MLKRISMLVVILALVVSQVACTGPLSKLDSALDYAPFFFQALVIQGAISQEQAEQYKTGVVKFELAADETKTCLSADVKPDTACYAELGTTVKDIVVQFYPNVGGSGKVGQYLVLIQDIVALIIRKNTPSQGVGGPRVTDDQIEGKIDELDNLLKTEAKKVQQ